MPKYAIFNKKNCPAQGAVSKAFSNQPKHTWLPFSWNSSAKLPS